MSTNEKIKLDITSAFDPGGFAKAGNSIKNLGGEMKKSSKVAKELMTAFGSADGAIGNAAGTFNKLGAAFSGGGAWALAAAGVALLVSKFYEAKEAAIQFAEEQRKSFRDELISKMGNALEGIRTKHADIADQMDRSAKAAANIAKAYADFAEASSEASNSQADLVASLLKGELQTKLLAEEDPVKRKELELDYERKIFEVKKNAAKQERDNKEKAADKKVNEAQKEVDAEIERRNGLVRQKTDLESYLGKSKQTNFEEEYRKANPMPADIGVIGTLLDNSTYMRAMDEWIAGWKAFDESRKKEIEIATKDLKKVNADIEDSGKSITSKYVTRGVAQEKRKSVLKKNKVEENEGYIAEGELSSIQMSFEKAKAEYKKVQQQISKQEGEIASAKDRETLREERRQEWRAQSENAKQLGAGGWRRMNEAADEASSEVGKDTMKEKNWVEGAKKRMATGAQLSGKDLKRIFGYDDWKKLQGVNPFDPARASENQITRMEDQLKELRELNTNLKNSLKVK